MLHAAGLSVFRIFPEFRNFDNLIGTYRYYFKNDFLFFGVGGTTSTDHYAISLNV